MGAGDARVPCAELCGEVGTHGEEEEEGEAPSGGTSCKLRLGVGGGSGTNLSVKGVEGDVRSRVE
jgi:hypothetical protein